MQIFTESVALGVDINGQLVKAQLEKLSSDPTGSEARIYWNTSSLVPKIYNGTSWLSLYINGATGLFADGSVTAPSIAFNSDADGTGTGLYRVGANNLGFAANGVAVGNISSVGTATFGSTSGGDGNTHLFQSNGNTNLKVDSNGTNKDAAITIDNSTNNSATVSTLRYETAGSLRWSLRSGQGFTNGGTITADAIEFANASGTTAFSIAQSGLVTAGAITHSGTLTSGNTGSVANQTFSTSDTGSDMMTLRNYSTSTSSDVRSLLQLVKGSTTNTSSQRFVRFLINATGTESGLITANGASQVTFTTNSDRRLKKNIKPLGTQLAKIRALKPSEFDYRDGSGHQVGFIAQDVQKVYPDIVTTNEETGMLTVAGLSKSDARLIKALQELADKLDALEAEFSNYKETHP